MAVKRARRKKPKIELTGIRAANWRSEPELLIWAQTNPTFRQIVTVLINERSSASVAMAGDTENVQLGRCQGYEIAVKILESLAEPMDPPAAPAPEVTYPSDELEIPVYS